ncbi:MAG: hypothetical protein ABMA64_43370 [Myxococcota bacterium]
MVVGRKVRDAAEAAELLDAAEASQLERADWARANGIDPRSLNAWRLNLRRHRREQPSLRLVELVAASEASRAPVVVRCGPFAVEVAADVDHDLLRRVLATVASC